MIDTIVLTLCSPFFTISDVEKFTPSARWIMGTNSWTSRGIHSKQNPTKKELSAGIYKPRLTLFHRTNLRGKQDIILKIELSLPKLFFGNNFEELHYKDFAPLSQKLVDTLKEMGVNVDSDTLSHAPVSAVHYSRNIPLTDGLTPYHFLTKIKEAHIKHSLDVNQTDYRNEGHSYKWHCNSYEVIFYDKIRDLEATKKSNKRSIEKDNSLQLNLSSSLNKRKKFELLRMEARLNKRNKIKNLFQKIGIKAPLTFKKIFKPAISKKVLLYYLDELTSNRPALLDYKGPFVGSQNEKALLATLIIHNPELSPKRILQMFGLKKALEAMTIRELQSMFGNKKKRSWNRIMKDVKNLTLPETADPLEKMRKVIEHYKPLKLSAIKK